MTTNGKLQTFFTVQLSQKAWPGDNGLPPDAGNVKFFLLSRHQYFVVNMLAVLRSGKSWFQVCSTLQLLHSQLHCHTFSTPDFII